MPDFVSIPDRRRPPDDYYSIDRSRVTSIHAVPFVRPLGFSDEHFPETGWRIIAQTDIGVPASGPAQQSHLDRYEFIVETEIERDRIIRLLEGAPPLVADHAFKPWDGVPDSHECSHNVEQTAGVYKACMRPLVEHLR